MVTNTPQHSTISEFVVVAPILGGSWHIFTNYNCTSTCTHIPALEKLISGSDVQLQSDNCLISTLNLRVRRGARPPKSRRKTLQRELDKFAAASKRTEDLGAHLSKEGASG